MYIWIALAIFICIYLIYYCATWNVCIYEDYIQGFWAASDDIFCEKAGISSMLLYIGESVGSEPRLGYIVIDELTSQGFSLEYKTGWAGINLDCYHLHAKVKFDEEKIMPTHIDISVNILDGVMKITSDGVLYARLEKQHDITNIAKEQK